MPNAFISSDFFTRCFFVMQLYTVNLYLQDQDIGNMFLAAWTCNSEYVSPFHHPLPSKMNCTALFLAWRWILQLCNQSFVCLFLAALNETLDAEVRRLRCTVAELGGESLLSSRMAQQLAISQQVFQLKEQQHPNQLRHVQVHNTHSQEQTQTQSQRHNGKATAYWLHWLYISILLPCILNVCDMNQNRILHGQAQGKKRLDSKWWPVNKRKVQKIQEAKGVHVKAILI